MGRLIAVCASGKRQEPKIALNEAVVRIGGGVEGDSHSDHSSRPLSLLRREDIADAECREGFSIPPGALAENLVVEGLEAGQLVPGARLSLGDEVLLEVVERGKRPDEPHSYDYRGLCLLPTHGFFLRPLKGGRLRPGDAVSVEGGRLP